MFIKFFLKKSLILCLSFSLLIMPIVQIKKVEAASIVEKLLYSTLAVGLVTAYYNDVDAHGQEEMLANTKKQTGVYDDEEAKERILTIKTQLMAPGSIKSTYAIYANPKPDFNAFCTLGHVISINKGTLDRLDDDELAFVMSHEMAHGEGKHVVTGVQKAMALSIVAHSLDVQSKNIIAFGDEHNDLELLDYAGWGVAMQNATNQLKAVANDVTPKTNDEDGLADYLEEFLAL